MDNAAWIRAVQELGSEDVDTAVHAAEALHRECSIEDVERLLVLLDHPDPFFREAAAWPLSELAGPSYLGPLLEALQRGHEDGHDNDGLSTALIEMCAFYPEQVRQGLEEIIARSDGPLRRNAQWLLTFCPGVGA